MSTDTDGAPPSVRPAPADEPEPPEPRSGPEPVSAGSGWLQEEIRRRAAERSSSGGGRHARRDGDSEPPRGVGHVPRHSVAPPAGPRPTPTARAVDAVPPARPAPTPAGGPSLPAAGMPARRHQMPTDGGWSGPEPATPSGPTDGTQPPRRVPSAFTPGARGVADDAPATFGGPGFDAPATRAPRRAPAADVAEFGGPGFAAPATRDLPLDPDPASQQSVPQQSFPQPPVSHQQLPATGAPERPRVPGGSDIRPPARPARLLAAPSPAPNPPVVEALGRRPLPVDLSPADRLDLTGPMRPVDGPVPVPDGAPGGRADVDDTVLWSATMPPLVDGETTTATPAVPVDLQVPRAGEPASTRVRIVFSERRGGAHPVRTVVDIQESGAVGELLRSDLIGSQLTVALRFALLAGLTLGLLPLVFALFPVIGRAEVLGLRLPWLLLGFVVYPVLWGLGWWHTRIAERVEQNFADHVQE